MTGSDIPEVLGPDDLLTPAAAAALFGVNPKTLTRWARDGKIRHLETLGGHRRYRRGDVDALLRTRGGDDE